MISRRLTIAFCAAMVTLVLSACGGGGGSSVTVSEPLPPPVSDPDPLQIRTSFSTTRTDHYPLDAQNVRPEEPEALERYEASGHNNWVMVPAESEIASRDDVLAMLWETTAYQSWSRGANFEVFPSKIEGHRSPPDIRFDNDVPSEMRAATLRAIDNINAWLPWEKHVTVGSDADIQALMEAWKSVEIPLYGERDIWDFVYYSVLIRDNDVVDAVNEQVERTIEYEEIYAKRDGYEFDPDNPEILAAKKAAAEVIAIYEANRTSETEFRSALQAAYDDFQLKWSSAQSDLKAAYDAWSPHNVINVQRNSDSDSGVSIGSLNGIVISENAQKDVAVIQHELLHALGIVGGGSCYEKFGAGCDFNSFDGPMFYYSHVAVSKFPKSTMAYASPRNDTHGLSQIDGETLQAIYTGEHLWKHPAEAFSFLLAESARRDLLDSGWSEEAAAEEAEIRRKQFFEERLAEDEDPHLFNITDVSPENLGSWDDTIVRYEGRFSRDVWPDYYGFIQPAFGVDWRNGMARPWADGDGTQGTFAESGLTGSATWNGGLVGFTPRQEAVRGDSAIQVDLAELNGSAAFTSLEHWSAGAPPDHAGTGMQWGDGDLHYSIDLDGNYLRSTAGDEGYVSGRFVGPKHESAVGILEHPDLAAGWGAFR